MRNELSGSRYIPIGASALLWLAVALDCIGVVLRAEMLWRLGGLLAWIALVPAGLGAVLSTRTHAGCLRLIVTWLGMALFLAGRWLRGSAGVSPDAPLLAAAIVGAALYTMAWLFPRTPRPKPSVGSLH